MRFYLDTEFNGFDGQLISLALVPEDASFEFYEALHCDWPTPWVKKHVMPVINKTPVALEYFQSELVAYLSLFTDIVIIADWPMDISFFCQALMMEDWAACSCSKNISFQVRMDLNTRASTNPHNALDDARALREMALK